MSNLKLTKTDPGFSLKAEGGVVDLEIYDEIDGGYYGGVAAKDILAALKPHKDAKTINLLLNSPGGFVSDGVAIYSMLHQHKASVDVTIQGWACSVASVIAMAGDTIRISEGSRMMIHRAWGVVIGNADDTRKQAEELDSIDRQIAAIYAKRTGGDADSFLEAMSAETWYTAEEALADGLATELIEAKTKAAASFGAASLLQRYAKNIPADVVEMIDSTPAADDPEAANTETDDMPQDITPEAFKAKCPDAVKDWQNEAFTEGHESGKTEGEAEARERFAEVLDLCDGDAKLAAEMFVADADDTDILKALNTKVKAERDEAQAKADLPGVEPVGTAGKGDDSDEDKADAEIIKRASAIKTEYAQKMYLRSVNREDLIDRL